MRYWLMKTEPDTFSWDHLMKAPKKTTSWEGVRNFQARNLMRDEMKLGDVAFFYHSSCDVPGIVGIAVVVKEAHPDLSALDPKSEYYDEKSVKAGESKWAMVAVQAKEKFAQIVTLDAMRTMKGLEGMMLLKKGMRLSVQPVTAAEAKVILKAGKGRAV